MRSITELYGRHPESDIYIVGTGASMRVFPKDFLEDKITIGLNMAWKLLPVNYCITTRPELNIPEFMGEATRPEIQWCTVHRKLRTTAQKQFVSEQEKRFFFFETEGQHNPLPLDQPSIAGRIPDWVRRPTDNFLYIWTSISQTAANLAANMGATTVYLVGCDNCAIGGNHHAHDQHTLWKGVDPAIRYRQYEEGLAEVRAALRERGVRLLSLTPFVSLDDPHQDFVRLCGELGQQHYIPNDDITAEDRRLNSPHWARRIPRKLKSMLHAARR